MGNPWLDEDKARKWSPTGKPGQALRGERIETVMQLAAVHAPGRILDLGCGIGDIGAEALRRFPNASLVALDGAPVMVERSKGTLASYGSRARVVSAPLESDWTDETGEDFDVVLSSEALHHLESEEKQGVCHCVFDVLAPGGVFIVNDRIAFPEDVWPHYVALWDGVRAAAGFEPFPADLTYGEYKHQEAAGGDRPDDIEDQMVWLLEAGFEAVECFWRHANKAIWAGFKAG